MISIIIPIYNCEKFLPRCLESILSQSYSDYEVLLVNDGSTDGTAMVCNEYVAKSKGKFRYIEKKNGGVSSARNIGLNNVKGEYICFVDADDYVHQDYLRCLYEAYSEDADLVICGYHNPELCIFNIEAINSADEIIKLILGKVNNTCVWNKLFRYELLDNIYFADDIYMGEDALFCVEYAKRCNRAVVVNKALYYYELPTASILYRENPNFLKKYMSLIEAPKRMLLDVNMLSEYTIGIIVNALVDSVMGASVLAVNFRNTRALRFLSQEIKDVRQKYNKNMTLDSKLLLSNHILYFIKKSIEFKFQALLYYSKCLYEKIVVYTRQTRAWRN